jgi:hypothetical protein
MSGGQASSDLYMGMPRRSRALSGSQMREYAESDLRQSLPRQSEQQLSQRINYLPQPDPVAPNNPSAAVERSLPYRPLQTELVQHSRSSSNPAAMSSLGRPPGPSDAVSSLFAYHQKAPSDMSARYSQSAENIRQYVPPPEAVYHITSGPSAPLQSYRPPGQLTKPFREQPRTYQDYQPVYESNARSSQYQMRKQVFPFFYVNDGKIYCYPFVSPHTD